jgi:predicted nuclease of predicted toxin-antitoxin system
LAELRFYLDAHIDKQVAVQLRNHQVAVVRCQDVGLADVDDKSHLTYASENHLMLVTKDADFRDLHFQWLTDGKNHAGILFFKQRQSPTIGEIVKECLAYALLIREGVGKLEDDIDNQYIEV